MSETYDFGRLSPIEFEAFCVDLLGSEFNCRFESFAPGPDFGIDGRYSSGTSNTILQAKHYKNGGINKLIASARKESPKIALLKPDKYILATSVRLTPNQKDNVIDALAYPKIATSDIYGLTEINALLQSHPDVERRNIKLWLTSTAVLEGLLNNDIGIFTEATITSIAKKLEVFVANPSLTIAAKILEERHSLIISGPPGVGKTTLAQVLAAEYSDQDWQLISITDIDQAYKSYKGGKKQVFFFDDFLGKIKLDEKSLSAQDIRQIHSWYVFLASRPLS